MRVIVVSAGGDLHVFGCVVVPYTTRIPIGPVSVAGAANAGDVFEEDVWYEPTGQTNKQHAIVGGRAKRAASRIRAH